MKRITLFILMFLASFTLLHLGVDAIDTVTFTEGDWDLTENSIPFEFVHDEINEKLYVRAEDYYDGNKLSFDLTLDELNTIVSTNGFDVVDGMNIYTIEFTITVDTGTTFSDYDYSRLYIETDNGLTNSLFLPRNKTAIRISFDLYVDYTVIFPVGIFINYGYVGQIYRQFIGEPKQVLINNDEWKQAEIYFSTSEFEFDTVEADYNIQFLENRLWNLDTGQFETNVEFRSSNRMVIPENMYVEFNQKIYLNNLNFHHMLFWNSYGQYIGYYNTLNSTYQGTKYLGDTDVEVAPPESAKYFVIVADKLGTLRTYSELNNNSLYEIFNNNQFIVDWLNNDFVTLPNNTVNQVRYDNGAYVLDRYVKEYSLIASDIISANTTGTNIDSYFTKVITDSVQSYSFPQTEFIVDGWGIQIGSTDLVSNNRTVARGDTVTAVIKFNVAKGTYANLAAAQTALAGTKIWYQLATPLLANITSTFILTSEISKNDLLDWYDLYIYYSQWNEGMSALNFYSVQPYYLREVTYDDDLNVGDRIDRLFDSLALGTFGKILIAVVLMIIIGLGMALLKVPQQVLWLLEVALFLLFSLIGWFPVWLVIILAVLLLVNIYLQFRR